MASSSRRTSSEIRVADAIARRLARETRYAFGVPGGEVLSLMDALRVAGVRFVLARHETSAGFMAEGVQRVEGGVGLLVATVGPGVANTVNIVAHAQQSRRPLIVLTGCVDGGDQTTYTHQIFDHQQVLRSLCKASFRVAAANVAETVERAVQIATEGVAGVVHLDVPVGVADELVTDMERSAWPVARTTVHAQDAVFEAARRALSEARRPLVIAGLELLQVGGAAVLREIHARQPFPVLTTYEAKGVVDEQHAQCIGAVGLSPRGNAIALPLVEEADVVVLAGYDPVEMRHAWRQPWGADATVIDVTRRVGQHGMHHASCSLVGEPAAILPALFEDVTFPDDASWRGRCEEVRMQMLGAFPVSEQWGPSALLGSLDAALDGEDLVTVDTGAHRILLCQQWRFAESGRLMQSNGTSTMACALPFAIGAKLAAPSRRVVCVVGDGGLEMALGELGTLRDQGLAVTVVVIDDRSLALIEKKQRARRLKNVGVDYGAEGVDFSGTDYVAIARAFGGEGARVEDVASFETALKEAVARKERFTLLHAVVPRRAYDGAI